MVIHIYKICVIKFNAVWSILLFSYYGILLITGCILIWKIRKVSMTFANESKSIAFAIYNITISCVIVGVTNLVIPVNSSMIRYAIAGIIAVITTISVECSVFLPKVNLKLDSKWPFLQNL